MTGCIFCKLVVPWKAFIKHRSFASLNDRPATSMDCRTCQKSLIDEDLVRAVNRWPNSAGVTY